MAVFLAAGGLCAPARAQTQEALKAKLDSLKTWFQHFKQGLDDSVLEDEYQHRDFTAVAAVRGAPQEAAEPDKVYWKSNAKSKRAAEMKKQKAELGAALEQIMAGKIAEGTASLDAFEKSNPRSALLAEVKVAREKAKELGDTGASAQQ